MSVIFELGSIATLDFTAIKRKLMHPEAGEGWTLQRTEAVEREYRRFLFLMKTFPKELTAPTVDVDTFWHHHILDTMQYARDCDLVFGYFLHHYPYLGLDEADDDAVRERAGDRMRELYALTFGNERTGAMDDASCGARQAGPLGLPGSADAFCAVTADSVSSSVHAEPAFCAVHSQPAFCAVTAQTAFCAVNAKTAFCAVTSKTAFCAVTSAAADTAATASAASTAFCAVNGATAFCAVTQHNAGASEAAWDESLPQVQH